MKLTRQQKKALTALGIVFIILMLGLAGQADHTEAVIHSMSKSEYNAINEKLGGNASDYNIAKYYLKNYK